ncbi:MAG: hypothetical protein Q7S74_00010 [Nanoarchaeota archaeon]|nr:hypothetical protein [Nanoarchaeota archaeon]
MGNFRREGGSRGGYGGGSRSGGGFSRDRGSGGRGRSFGGGRGDRDFGGSDRKPVEMYDATCDKCGNQCKVPFRPTGSKPVFCNDCFRKNEGSSNSYGSRSQDRPDRQDRPVQAASGISQEQFNQLNIKLDKILAFLENLEVEFDEEESDDLANDLDDEEPSDNADDDLDEDSEDDEEEDDDSEEVDSEKKL